MKFKSMIIISVLTIIVLMIPTFVEATPTVQMVKINDAVVTSASFISKGDVLKIKIKTDIEDLETAILAIKFGTGNIINLTGTPSQTENGVIDFEYTLIGNEYGRLDASTLVVESQTSSNNETYSNLTISANDIIAQQNNEEDEPENDTNNEENNSNTNLEWTDFSNAKYEIVRNLSTYDFTIANVTMDTTHNYYAFFTETNNEPSVNFDTFGYVTNNDFNAISAVVKGLNNGEEVSKYFEKNVEKLYLWIVETQKDETIGKQANKFVVSGIAVNRLEQLPIGARINAHFFDDYTRMSINEIYSTPKTINVKIGKVTDNSILKSIKNGESGCLSKLMTYAKSEGKVYSHSFNNVEYTKEMESITDKFNVTDKGYYYAYLEIEDENGKYYPVEDVSLYQGLRDTNGGMALLNYLDSKFVWNLQDDGTTTTTDTPDTTKATITLPQTGKEAIIGVTIITVIAVAIILFKKNNNYKDI